MPGEHSLRFDENHNSRKSGVILIAEAHDALQDSLKDLVITELPDIRVLTVCSGKEAVKLFLASRPSAVVLDVDLPELNGVEATRKIHSCRPDIPIVLINEEEVAEFQSSAIAAGARGYVIKQRIAVDLVPMLKKLLLSGSRKNKKTGSS
jgi:DNA-binding NarL/FixJ family response regulator